MGVLAKDLRTRVRKDRSYECIRWINRGPQSRKNTSRWGGKKRVDVYSALDSASPLKASLSQIYMLGEVVAPLPFCLIISGLASASDKSKEKYERGEF